MNAKRMEIQKTLEWAELFDTAPRETKRMILASFIERVTVGARLQDQCTIQALRPAIP